ncbi:fatty acid-binding protein, intestinal-like [Myxocyprinus asiaticus]|uniref:fatty acid-binding protein, intestinal-like n=1 Tax=Myxocyprinus asiaticus TaxID=70543 RepID=UPI00222147EF|nr:fatty acid-binding protein, intestinal-like [Myxocyprinus asiaticus]
MLGSQQSAIMTFNGTWKVDRNENYEKFMEQMGINMVKRKLAAHDNLKITLEQKGDKFVVKEVSTFRTLDIEFTLGITFEYSLADGTELSGSWVMEGDMLKGTFTRKDNGKVLITTRKIIGDELVQSYSYDGVEAKRIFKRG